MKYIIVDWAGNELFNHQLFNTFDDAWEHLYVTFPNEEDFSDYEVIEL